MMDEFLNSEVVDKFLKIFKWNANKKFLAVNNTA
jgi:hypothetical protein